MFNISMRAFTIDYKSIEKSTYALYAIVCSLLLLTSTLVHSRPEGANIVGGTGTIEQIGNETIVRQQSDHMAIDWQSYDLNTNELVKYIQPSSDSISLNRILSNRGSEIQGRIEANGIVILVNPNGLIFGQNSVVNAGGLIASGLSIDTEKFMNGEFFLSANDTLEGIVSNSGMINASIGGSVSLIGQQVVNEGLISANLGVINLAAGKEAILTFGADSLIGVRVTKDILQENLGIDPGILNSGTLEASGGNVLISAAVSRDIFSQVINTGNTGHSTRAIIHDDGSFSISRGSNVLNTGLVNVSTTEVFDSINTGRIQIKGKNVINSGDIEADSFHSRAGQIELHALDSTLLTENSRTTAIAHNTGYGGDVKLLGNKIALSDLAFVDASGANGGGEILVGGDHSGANPSIRNAESIYLGEQTQVNTNAIDNGDGGKLIVFAENTVRVYGELSALGGMNSGNGGIVETSSLGLEILKAPNVGAKHGLGGEWLIEPLNIDIVNNDVKSDSNIISVPTFEPIGNITQLASSTILEALNSGEGINITIQTTGNGGDGNITFETSLDYNGIGNEEDSLVLNAQGDINLNNFSIYDSNDTGDRLNINFNSDFDTTSNGGIWLTNIGDINISTGGGSFTASGASFFSSGINHSISTNGGDIILDIDGDILIGAGIDSNNGNIRLNASGFIDIQDNIITSNSTVGTSKDTELEELIINNDFQLEVPNYFQLIDRIAFGEKIEEVDPVVFQSVRNYLHEYTSILLPPDQVFEDVRGEERIYLDEQNDNPNEEKPKKELRIYHGYRHKIINGGLNIPKNKVVDVINEGT